MDFTRLANDVDSEAVSSIVLMGSFARGDQRPLSDVDLLRFFKTKQPANQDSNAVSHLVEDRLVVVTDVFPDTVETWFSQPEEAVKVIRGLQTAKPLIDRNGYFEGIQEAALNFVWDAEMQYRANLWSSRELVSWTEEVQKGLEGLQRNEMGRLLHARYGLSWGLVWTTQVALGVLVSSDNFFFQEIDQAVDDPQWSKLCRQAFGVTSSPNLGRDPLQQQVYAGLAFYLKTVEVIDDMILPEYRSFVERTIALINNHL